VFVFSRAAPGMQPFSYTFVTMDKELKIMFYSFIPPALLVMVMWLVKYAEYACACDFGEYGVFPRSMEGIRGIFLSPFIHGDIEHLASNSVPLLLLGAGLVYFYRELAIRVFALIYFLSGAWLWIAGREVYHIGASGLIYGLAFFLFVSGVLRRDTRLMAISLLVVFLYGSMVWGVFPLWRGISWEAHLFGSIAGILCAVVYRKKGPQRQAYIWEMEDEMEETETEAETETETERGNPTGQESNNSGEEEVKVNYIYKVKDPKTNEPQKD
jgi:membrane associated rhomboid family serine protease